MANPTPATNRPVPADARLREGFSTVIALSVNSTVGLWPDLTTGTQPPGMDGGEPVPTGTMLNLKWRTFGLRKLKTMMPSTVKCAYDPSVYDLTNVNSLAIVINVEQTLTVFFSNNDRLAMYGGINKFVPESIKEGVMPLADVTFVPTNTDPSNGTEADPVFAAATGT
jgi:hypothetical protein